MKMKQYSKLINLKGELYDLSTPVVMGIVNITPDSFFEGSRFQTEKSIAERTQQAVEEGALLLDLGAFSSRPGANNVTAEEEWSRLKLALEVVQRTAPDALVSVDTFRADVAQRAIDEFGVAMINDISGGLFDKQMFRTVAKSRVAYVLMHLQGTMETMHQSYRYEHLLKEVFLHLAAQLEQLRELGACDVVIDPGFGFSKSLDDNYSLMRELSGFRIFELPLLVGISRKSMICKELSVTPQESLNGTTVLNTFALLNGADILRVHDVKEAVEAIRLVTKINKL